MMDEDESNELFGLLEGAAAAAAAVSAGRGGRSGDDPLSRLLATMQSRRERRAAAALGTTTASSSVNDANAAAAQPVSASDSAVATIPMGSQSLVVSKESMDLCDRLYALMREAEREEYFLRLRVSAWRRLECDALSVSDSVVTQIGSDPASVCSSCAASVALHLLNLWLALFRLQPDQVQLAPDAIQLLCSEEASGDISPGYDCKSSSCARALVEVKRFALKEIALLGTPHASGLVLDALRLRLLATQSVWCSEVLGSIIEAGGPRAFRDLAMEVLECTADL
jgi:hypothetical protein